MNKEERIRKLLIIIGSVMLIVGAYMALTRGNPIDEKIGYVFITNGFEKMEVKGHKYSYNSGDNISEIESFVSIDNAEDIPEIDYFPDNDDCKLLISYGDDYTGELSYSVFDENFNCIIDSMPTLSMPGEAGKKYYVQSSVNWGDKKKSVTVKYYFAVNVKNE